MSVQRSPIQVKNSSNPNLVALDLVDTPHNPARKRKCGDLYMDTLAEILKSIKENDHKISKLSDDINKGIKQELKNLSNSFQQLRLSLEHTDQQLQDVNKRVTCLEKQSSKVEDLEGQIKSMQITICDLQADRGKDQQRARMMNLEIVGVPECKNENLLSYVFSLANYASIQLQKEDVDNVTRVQKMHPSKDRPRNIIIKLKNRLIKDNLLSGLRKARVATTQNLGLSGESRRIFVNEHLTPENKMLYKLCRQKAKELGFQYTWIRNCMIYARKNNMSPHILIESERDLKKMCKTTIRNVTLAL